LGSAPAATVTQIFHNITLSATPSGKTELAAVGATLHDGEYLKTGKTSLAELELANKTITRLGPSTIFTYSGSTREANLQTGTILFSKPKDGSEFTIKTSNVTAPITGTTGFVERQGNSVVFGVIEGTVQVTVGTAKAILKAGKMLACVPGANPQIVSFDVPNFVSTSAFFHGFQRPLPNEKYVEKEIAEYHNLVSRGFIEPIKTALAATGPQTAGASNRAAGSDANGNAASASGVSGTSVASNGNASSSGFAISGGSLSVNGSGSGSSTSTIASGTGISRTGAGTITLAGANTYSGGTTVSGGTLLAGGNIGSTSGGTLSVNGSGTSAGAVLAGAASNTYSGAITTVSGGTLNTGSTINLGGTISIGSGGLISGGTISGGTGTLTFTGGGGTGIFTTPGGTLTPGSTIVNSSGNPITIDGVTIQPHSSYTVH